MPRRASTEQDYTARVDRVIDHVQQHYAEPLGVAALARVAHFSPFHFHRVFRAHTGETLGAFVTRVRVQRAALLLGRGGSRTKLVDVALEAGFGSASEFSRAFRASLGVSPSAFRRRAEMSKIPQERAPTHSYLPRHERLAEEAPLRVALVARPSLRVRYVRVQDPFARDRLARACAQLDAYAEARGIAAWPRLGLSLDDPELTPPSQCRYDLALPTHLPGRGSGLSTRVLASGTFAELRVRGHAGDVARAWDRLFAEWLPGSGYQPADGPGVERYVAAPDFHAWRGFDLVLGLPVVRLTRAR